MRYLANISAKYLVEFLLPGMDPEIQKKFEEQDRKLEQIFLSVEKMRRYFLWTLIISIAVIVLPLIGLLIVIPQFLSLYSGANLGL